MAFRLSSFYVVVLLFFSQLVAADHWITVVNKCPYTILATLVDTSCTYSAARCGKTNPYNGDCSLSIVPGANSILKLPNNFVGRIFDLTSSSSCGTDGWDCSIFNFNFDDGPAATSQSYNIANTQGFTIGMQAVPYPANTGCLTKTCWSANCPADQAYPPGSTTAYSANTSCGTPNLGVTLYFCGN